jgi:hypothetical protein
MPSLRVRKAADLLPSTTLTGHFSCCCCPRRIDQSGPFWSSSGSRQLGKIWLSYCLTGRLSDTCCPGQKAGWLARSSPSSALPGAGDNDAGYKQDYGKGCRNGRTAHRKTDHQGSGNGPHLSRPFVRPDNRPRPNSTWGSGSSSCWVFLGFSTRSNRECVIGQLNRPCP